jgi:hypothetical protein
VRGRLEGSAVRVCASAGGGLELANPTRAEKLVVVRNVAAPLKLVPEPETPEVVDEEEAIAPSCPRALAFIFPMRLSSGRALPTPFHSCNSKSR